MKLEALEAGARVFVDSTIFVYHFTGASPECRDFLERCERGEIKGMTSTLVLAEVAHRLMMLESVARGLVSPGNLARKLRERPEVVRQLQLYQEQVERIPLMGIDVLPLNLSVVLRSRDLRRRYGLMVNDSLVGVTALENGTDALASADSDFERLEDVRVFRPEDLA